MSEREQERDQASNGGRGSRSVEGLSGSWSGATSRRGRLSVDEGERATTATLTFEDHRGSKDEKG